MSEPTANRTARIQAHQARMLERASQHLARLSWDRATLEAHQEQQLRALLAHAIAHSRFHAERLAGIDPAAFRLADLPTLPVMTKADLMGRFDDIVTDPRVTRDLVEAHISAMTGDPFHLLDEYLVVTSGGSSGVRGVFLYDWDGAADATLAVVRRGLAAGPGPQRAGRRPGRPRLATVSGSAGYHASQALSRVMAPAIYDVIGQSVTSPLTEVVANLDGFDPDTLMAYPSALTLLATERLAGRLTITPALIRAMGEPFTDDHRALAARAFPEAALVDLFGSSEGLFGLSAPGARPIELAEDLAIVELVDADDRPVPLGTPCARVLLTVLVNPVQPLIRYELTDVMVEHPGPSAFRHVTVEGRNDDPFRYGDTIVLPIVFRSTLNAFATVVEYQVRQTTHGAHIDIVTSGPLDEDATVTALRTALGKAGLTDPDVTVDVVADLNRNASTGKFRRFVPLR